MESFYNNNITTHYIFVNFCLDILSSRKLPSYCYYDDNNQLNTFYENLTENDKIKIYTYLVENGYINPEIIIRTDFIQNIRKHIESFCQEQ